MMCIVSVLLRHSDAFGGDGHAAANSFDDFTLTDSNVGFLAFDGPAGELEVVVSSVVEHGDFVVLLGMDDNDAYVGAVAVLDVREAGADGESWYGVWGSHLAYV